ncbi:tripartite tricarboxylate transporter substrate binding protein [Pseudalkalibacillus sp. A8]|uniref:tripartite tricarboxylate transporter substrate binding protein n=1 Tax=Pseudalkalibacillus sp. A8 TaxID=3382641 RepID=UPI0038B622AC
MKKVFMLVITVLLTFTMAACGQETSGSAGGEGAGDFPDKPINVIVSYEAGGGTDTGARILLPYVEEELGVTVNVINKPGGGGWVGWTELANADPDGYTIGYINTPNLMTGYLDPKFNRKQNLESFEPIANHVTDPGAIAIRADEDRFTNIEELMEYAKENELTATSTGVGSDDHYASLKLNDKFGTKFKPVHNKGAADSKASVLGGHVDVLFANVGELASLQKEGDIKIIAVMSKERSPFLEDVPTLEESGFEDVYSWSARGLAAPAGIDPEKLEILRAAFEKGIKNEEQKKKMGDMGLQVDYLDGEEYKQLLKDDEKAVKDLSDLMGW